MNNVSLLGRTTADVDLKTTQSGKSVVSFTLAVRRKYSKDKTDWINLVAWDKQAEFLSKYVSKGQLIGIEGNIQTRSYEDKNGNKRSVTEVIVDNVYFADSKKRDENTNNEPEYADYSDLDLPF